jgi:hypothetical protein
MSYDVTPFYGFATFSQNRLDALLRLIVGNLSGINAPTITLNDISGQYNWDPYLNTIG